MGRNFLLFPQLALRAGMPHDVSGLAIEIWKAR
jgi:hypothetical protein